MPLKWPLSKFTQINYHDRNGFNTHLLRKLNEQHVRKESIYQEETLPDQNNGVESEKDKHIDQALDRIVKQPPSRRLVNIVSKHTHWKVSPTANTQLMRWRLMARRTVMNHSNLDNRMAGIRQKSRNIGQTIKHPRMDVLSSCGQFLWESPRPTRISWGQFKGGQSSLSTRHEIHDPLTFLMNAVVFSNLSVHYRSTSFFGCLENCNLVINKI